MLVYKPGLQFCVFHGDNYIEMIDCPLDSTHQVRKDKLETHLKKCNKLKLITKTQENPFYEEKINN